MLSYERGSGREDDAIVIDRRVDGVSCAAPALIITASRCRHVVHCRALRTDRRLHAAMRSSRFPARRTLADLDRGFQPSMASWTMSPSAHGYVHPF